MSRNVSWHGELVISCKNSSSALQYIILQTALKAEYYADFLSVKHTHTEIPTVTPPGPSDDSYYTAEYYGMISRDGVTKVAGNKFLIRAARVLSAAMCSGHLLIYFCLYMEGE